MTKEEAIYRLNNTAWLGSHADRVATEEAVQMAIEALKAQATLDDVSIAYENGYKQGKFEAQQWIPCSERMPSEPFGCIVTVMDTEPMTQAEFPNLLPYFVGYDGKQWNDGDGEQCPFEVLAWMPLPSPYKENES